ncbi:MAG: DUF2207 domain-containing protein [Candidatus Moranbacteria bacterium]|nr:DUF2207 domain-containing protein [Candidatus Moranbacteria bacterium]
MSFAVKQFFRKQKVQVLLGLLFTAFFFSISQVSAQVARNYSYDAIDYTIHVNQDTTVDVTETQTYNFIGEYHQGWRNIPKKGIDDLTDVSVVDKTIGRSLTYSATRLVKTDPASWGKYTTFFENGEYIIEWYYNARDTTNTWKLRYRLHGAIGFYKDHDELYWNLFTAYQVPIGKIDVDVILPNIVSADDLKETLYVNNLVRGNHSATHSDGNFHFFANDILPGGIVTIAPGWPKGIVNQGAYWRYWLGKYWGYVGAIAIALVTIVTLILRWYVTERYHAGRGLVIPEYEPPKNLPPAMADILVHENLSSKAWAATVIDLAIRGNIKIEEKKKGKIEIFFSVLVQAVLWISLGVMTIVVLPSFFQEDPSWESRLLLSLVTLVIFSRPLLSFWGVLSGETPPSSFLSRTDYVLTEMSDTAKGARPLQDYEKEFLGIIFGYSGRFDTKDMRSNPTQGQALFKGLQKLKKNLEKEIAQDTNAYEVGFRAWRISKIVLAVTGGFIIWGLFVLASLSNYPLIIFSVVAGYCLLALILFFCYNPRLNKQGQILREEWLGFKLYLETAEKNRMQNLTPEIFEKYLPYAIIFGVEKKWGKAFENISMPQPAWYSGASMGVGSSLPMSSGGFSASAFSSSFSSSFSSAFSSAGGGGGASGGGGGAGGGGGGGGGGAS